jgi:hypothetical protein
MTTSELFRNEERAQPAATANAAEPAWLISNVGRRKMKTYVLFLGLAVAAIGAPAPPIADVKLEARSGTAVPWSRDHDQVTLYLGCGPLEFANEKKEARTTDENYFYAWMWNYQEHEFRFHIIERIDGTLPEISFVDLNGDGTEEIVLKYVAGAHTRMWRIYRRVGRYHEIEKIGDVFSDWGNIFATEEKKDGYAIIEAWQRHYPDQRLVIRSRFSVQDGRYKEEPNQPPEPTPLTRRGSS